MILKASQRGGARQLAAHLLNDRDNDHITVHELRGYMAADLRGALAETYAVARGTRCQQFLFSLSLNPPKGADAGINDFLAAAERVELALGLKGQPRAIVVHEKNGRRHAHVVWSRIDAFEMKAINMAYFKTKLRDLSRELYLEHGWELPEGHKTNGWKNPLNFTLAEWQQAKRLDLDPREIKQVFQNAWARSDNLASFRAALEEHGYFLARGDRRGLVALDIQGEVLSVSRWSGIKPKALSAKLSTPEALPSVEAAKVAMHKRLSARLRAFIAENRHLQRQALEPLAQERARMVATQRAERVRLAAGQDRRWQTEAKARGERFRKGFGAAWDVLTGKARTTRQDNEREAYAAFLRDREQREALVKSQGAESAALQRRWETLQQQQRQERTRFVRKVMTLLPWTRDASATRGRAPVRSRDRGLEL